MKKLLVVLFISFLAVVGYTQEIVFDVDSNAYNTVKIGNQVWLKENLKVTRYNNGDTIYTCGNLYLQEDQVYKYQWVYNDNEVNVAVYGRLYTWYAVTDPRGVCPVGWHIATEQEWEQLKKNYTKDAALPLMDNSGKYWEPVKNIKPNNSTGFTALPAGQRTYSYYFDELNKMGHWWTSTTLNDEYANRISIRYSDKFLVFHSSHKNTGLSVRCIKND